MKKLWNIVQRFFKKENTKALLIQQIKSLDFQNGKKAAYDFTFLARQLELTEREKRLFEEIFEALDTYKYTKTSKPLDIKTIAKIEVFIESVS